MDRQDSINPWPLLCDRCLCQLEQDVDEFYAVHVEAVVKSLPREDVEELEQITEESSSQSSEEDAADIIATDVDGAAKDLVEDIAEFCEELREIHRQVGLTLCRACYQQWIENPTG